MLNISCEGICNDLSDGNEPRVIGYDEVFDPPVTQDYECPICMMVLRNPIQTPCGHRFCMICMHRNIATNGPTCPCDRKRFDEREIFTDNFAKREINQLNVKCRTVKNNGDCSWTGPLQDIKVHMGECQNVIVSCPYCNEMILRRRLTSSHLNDCPQAQVYCDFRPYGCTWTGLRLHFQNHLTSEAAMAAHLSMLGVAMSALIPGNGHGEAGVNSAASGSTNRRSGSASGKSSIWEELNRACNRNAESILTLEAKCKQLERKYCDLKCRIEWQQAQNEASLNAIKKSLVELEARMCNGIYLWRIVGYARHLENARENIGTALQSPPFYTSFYGYKLCLRIHPNGVDTGYGSHVSLFVHMMQSDWDDTLEWPFSGRISLSILDQSDDGENKRHISETLVTRPNLLALQRPTAPRNPEGYGYVEFAHIETSKQDRHYVKNDCLLVRVQVFE